jgi:hypothetical protein
MGSLGSTVNNAVASATPTALGGGKALAGGAKAGGKYAFKNLPAAGASVIVLSWMTGLAFSIMGPLGLIGMIPLAIVSFNYIYGGWKAFFQGMS